MNSDAVQNSNSTQHHHHQHHVTTSRRVRSGCAETQRRDFRQLPPTLQISPHHRTREQQASTPKPKPHEDEDDDDQTEDEEEEEIAYPIPVGPPEEEDSNKSKIPFPMRTGGGGHSVSVMSSSAGSQRLPVKNDSNRRGSSSISADEEEEEYCDDGESYSAGTSSFSEGESECYTWESAEQQTQRRRMVDKSYPVVTSSLSQPTEGGSSSSVRKLQSFRSTRVHGSNLPSRSGGKKDELSSSSSNTAMLKRMNTTPNLLPPGDSIPNLKQQQLNKQTSCSMARTASDHQAQNDELRKSFKEKLEAFKEMERKLLLNQSQQQQLQQTLASSREAKKQSARQKKQPTPPPGASSSREQHTMMTPASTTDNHNIGDSPNNHRRSSSAYSFASSTHTQKTIGSKASLVSPSSSAFSNENGQSSSSPRTDPSSSSAFSPDNNDQDQGGRRRLTQQSMTLTPASITSSSSPQESSTSTPASHTNPLGISPSEGLSPSGAASGGKSGGLSTPSNYFAENHIHIVGCAYESSGADGGGGAMADGVSSPTGYMDGVEGPPIGTHLTHHHSGSHSGSMLAPLHSPADNDTSKRRYADGGVYHGSSSGGGGVDTPCSLREEAGFCPTCDALEKVEDMRIQRDGAERSLAQLRLRFEAILKCLESAKALTYYHLKHQPELSSTTMKILTLREQQLLSPAETKQLTAVKSSTGPSQRALSSFRSGGPGYRGPTPPTDLTYSPRSKKEEEPVESSNKEMIVDMVMTTNDNSTTHRDVAPRGSAGGLVLRRLPISPVSAYSGISISDATSPRTRGRLEVTTTTEQQQTKVPSSPSVGTSDITTCASSSDHTSSQSQKEESPASSRNEQCSGEYKYTTDYGALPYSTSSSGSLSDEEDLPSSSRPPMGVLSCSSSSSMEMTGPRRMGGNNNRVVPKLNLDSAADMNLMNVASVSVMSARQTLSSIWVSFTEQLNYLSQRDHRSDSLQQRRQYRQLMSHTPPALRKAQSSTYHKNEDDGDVLRMSSSTNKSSLNRYHSARKLDSRAASASAYEQECKALRLAVSELSLTLNEQTDLIDHLKGFNESLLTEVRGIINALEGRQKRRRGRRLSDCH